MASLRDHMPQTAEWIDELRAVFGTNPEDLASINRQIKAGIDGQQGMFYAAENGRTVGRKETRQGVMPVLPLKTAQAPDFAAKNAKGRK